MKRSFIVLLIVVVLAPLVAAQDRSVLPEINKPFANPDIKGFLAKFEIESREIYSKRKEVVAACKLKPGMVVADIGAGTGLYTRLFAKEVGSEGKVIAVDIAKSFLDHIEKSCKADGIKNVETVQCNQLACNLPEASIDFAFICDTYHHFEFPQRTMHSIRRSLKPGGQLLVIDFKRVKGQSSDWVMNHVRAGQEVFSAEIRGAGFKPLDEIRLLKENYCLRFERQKLPSDDKDRPRNKLAKASVVLKLESVKPHAIEDRTDDWVTFRFHIDNQSKETLHVYSQCFSAFDGLAMVYKDADGRIVHVEDWTRRCSPMFESKAYALKPGVNKGSINCRLPKAEFAKVRSFQMVGVLPSTPYGHWLESNVVTLEK